MHRLVIGILLCVFGVSAALAQSVGDPLAPPPDMNAETVLEYEQGRLLFNGHWRPTGTNGPDDLAGLGPLYNRIACASCHSNGGRGEPPPGPGENFLTALVRIGIVTEDGTVQPHPLFGGQIQDRAIPDVAPEASLSLEWQPVDGRYPDGTPFQLRRPALTITPDPGPDARWSIRIAPPVRGMGLLGKAVSPGDNGGVFGWKAAQPNLVAQNASALAEDMGITSLYHPDPICPSGEDDCGGGRDEIGGFRLMLLSLFTEHLPPPQPVTQALPSMQALFVEVGCAACHVPALPQRLGPELVAAYSDLSLHDMGPGLDDGLPEGVAKSSEWRTPPLWGIGTELARDPALALLHDGRARGVEEAILWHDGEAAAARTAFMKLPAARRADLLRFVSGL